jgi:hypothetical protein
VRWVVRGMEMEVEVVEEAKRNASQVCGMGDA